MKSRSQAGNRWCWLGVGLTLALLSYPALAQTTTALTQLNNTLSSIVGWLQGAGVIVVTLAIAWAGYKMIFQNARWHDIATIVLGAVLIGGAATIAGILIPQ